jgi:hypothetical protein
MTGATVLVSIAGIITFIAFYVLPWWRWSTFYYKERRTFDVISDKSAQDAQIGSIKNHNLATGLNSAGLGFGIIAVFYGSKFDERYLDVGVAVVLGSIITFLVYEWVAAKYDEQVAKIGQTAAKIEVGDLNVMMPESLVLDKDCIRLIYPSGTPGPAETSQRSPQGRS